MTRACLPTMGYAGLTEQVCEHFGRARTYTFVDADGGRVEVVANTTLHAGGEDYPPDLIAALGGEVVICSALGRRAVGLFEDRGITVHVGASGSVVGALEMWRTGQLQVATLATACQEHAFRGEDHGHGHDRQHHHG